MNSYLGEFISRNASNHVETVFYNVDNYNSEFSAEAFEILEYISSSSYNALMRTLGLTFQVQRTNSR